MVVLFTDRNDVLKAIGMSDDSDKKSGGVGAVGVGSGSSTGEHLRIYRGISFFIYLM